MHISYACAGSRLKTSGIEDTFILNILLLLLFEKMQCQNAFTLYLIKTVASMKTKK